MSQWVSLLDADSLGEGQVRAVQVGERWIGVAHWQGRFVAFDNVCPHAGGSLGHGELADGCVVCPVHRWPWNLGTGKTAEEWEQPRLKIYAVDRRGDRIWVDLSRAVNRP